MAASKDTTTSTARGSKHDFKGLNGQIADEFVLEKVCGVSCASKKAIAANPTNGSIAFAASSVLVLSDPRYSEQEFLENPSGRTIKAVAYSDDGKYVAFGEVGYNPKIVIFHANDRKQINTFQLSGMCSVKAIEFNYKSIYLAVLCSNSFTIGLFDLKGKRIASATFVVEPLGMTLPKVGAFLVVCGQRKVSLFSMLDIDTHVCHPNIVFDRRSVLLGHQGNYTFVDVTSGEGPHERKVYTVTSCGYLCDIKVGDILIDNATKIDDRCFCVKYSIGCLFIGCARNTIKICSPGNLSTICSISDREVFEASLHLPAILKFEANIIAIAVNSVTRIITCVFSDHRRHSWSIDLSDPKCIECVAVIPVDADGNQVPWEPTSCQIQGKVASVLNKSTCHRTKANVRDAKDSKQQVPCPEMWKTNPGYASNRPMSCSKPSTSTCYVNATRFTPDGKIICGNAEGEIKIFDAVTGRLNRVIEAHSSAITHIELLWDDHFWLVASGGRDRVIFILDAQKDHSLVQVLCDHSSAIVSISMAHHNGTLTLVSSAADGVILIRRAIKGKHLRFVIISELSEFGGKPRIYAYGNDYIITGGDNGQINLFQTDPFISTKPTKTIMSSTKGKRYLKAVAIDPSGYFLVANSTTGTLIFNIQNGRHIATMSKMLNMSLITFTNDCKYLVNESTDGCRFLWRLPQRMTDMMKAKIEDSGTNAKDGHLLYDKILSSVDLCPKEPAAYPEAVLGLFPPVDRRECIAMKTSKTFFQGPADLSSSESDCYSCLTTCSRSYTDVYSSTSPVKITCRFSLKGDKETSTDSERPNKDTANTDEAYETTAKTTSALTPSDSPISGKTIINSVSYSLPSEEPPEKACVGIAKAGVQRLGKSPTFSMVDVIPKSGSKTVAASNQHRASTVKSATKNEAGEQQPKPRTGSTYQLVDTLSSCPSDNDPEIKLTSLGSHLTSCTSPMSVYLSAGSRASMEHDEFSDEDEKPNVSLVTKMNDLVGVNSYDSIDQGKIVDGDEGNTNTLSGNTSVKMNEEMSSLHAVKTLKVEDPQQQVKAECQIVTSTANEQSMEACAERYQERIEYLISMQQSQLPASLQTSSPRSHFDAFRSKNSRLTDSSPDRSIARACKSPEETAASESPTAVQAEQCPLNEQKVVLVGDGAFFRQTDNPDKGKSVNEMVARPGDGKTIRTGDGDFPARHAEGLHQDVNQNTVAVLDSENGHLKSSPWWIKRSYSHFEKNSWNLHCAICLDRAKKANISDMVTDQCREDTLIRHSFPEKTISKDLYSQLSNSQETLFEMPKCPKPEPGTDDIVAAPNPKSRRLQILEEGGVTENEVSSINEESQVSNEETSCFVEEHFEVVGMVHGHRQTNEEKLEDSEKTEEIEVMMEEEEGEEESEVKGGNEDSNRLKYNMNPYRSPIVPTNVKKPCDADGESSHEQQHAKEKGLRLTEGILPTDRITEENPTARSDATPAVVVKRNDRGQPLQSKLKYVPTVKNQIPPCQKGRLKGVRDSNQRPALKLYSLGRMSASPNEQMNTNVRKSRHEPRFNPSPKYESKCLPSPKYESKCQPSPKYESKCQPSPKHESSRSQPSPKYGSKYQPSPKYELKCQPGPKFESKCPHNPKYESKGQSSPKCESKCQPSPNCESKCQPSPKCQPSLRYESRCQTNHKLYTKGAAQGTFETSATSKLAQNEEGGTGRDVQKDNKAPGNITNMCISTCDIPDKLVEGWNDYGFSKQSKDCERKDEENEGGGNDEEEVKGDDTENEGEEEGQLPKGGHPLGKISKPCSPSARFQETSMRTASSSVESGAQVIGAALERQGSNPPQTGIIEGLGSVVDLFRNQDDYLRKLREVRRNFEMSIQALREDRENRHLRSLRQKKED